ncbi:hypothetical protein PR048_027112 [Dryococelus australis]|uniref:Uncharacterized protein n=1 Tax=Dryococelus australis TaxID=614101 RepID=A0ABQ9GES5_9NEOP|nr:hypothetical protein PR048_027112 [Dryococelus australis]
MFEMAASSTDAGEAASQEILTHSMRDEGKRGSSEIDNLKHVTRDSPGLAPGHTAAGPLVVLSAVKLSSPVLVAQSTLLPLPRVPLASHQGEAAVAERLDCSPPNKAIRVQSPAGSPGFSHVGIVSDDAAGRWVFSGISSFPPPFHSGAAPYSSPFTLIGSQALDVKSRPKLFTHPISRRGVIAHEACVYCRQHKYVNTRSNASCQLGTDSTQRFQCLEFHASRTRHLQMYARERGKPNTPPRASCGDFDLMTSFHLISIQSFPATWRGRIKTRNSRSKWFAVAERLARSPPTTANRVLSPAGSLPDLRKWESCRTMPLDDGAFRGSPVSPPPLHSGAAPFSLHFARIGSQDFVVKSHQNL